MIICRASIACAVAVAFALAVNGLARAGSKVIRLATVPNGAEVTGNTVSGFGELFFNAQHPDRKAVWNQSRSAATIGYIADLNVITYDGPGVAVPPKDQNGRVHVAAGAYIVLGRSGDPLGSGQILGGVYDAKGDLMYVSNMPDFNALIPLSATQAYLYTAFEGGGRLPISAISRLKLVRHQGYWQSDYSSSEMLDLSTIGGGWVLCFGTVSPWGTPIFAEEYPFYNAALWNHPDLHDDDDRRISRKGNDMVHFQPKIVDQYLGRPSNPYRYGYNIELEMPAASKVKLVKRFAMGRFSHENVAVMPDGRTVYQSDDDSAKNPSEQYNSGSGGVLFKFIADHKADLSSGTLYAAKLKQDPGSDPRTTGFNVTWIKLARARDEQVAQWIAEYDDITVADHRDGQTNYVSDADINNWAEGTVGRDLNDDGQIGSYPDDRPAFLESRRAAAALGATNEWNKLEGVTATADNLYLAVSNISISMAKDWGHVHWATGRMDEADQGEIALDKEFCGAVYRAKLDRDYDIKRIVPLVVGKTIDSRGTCDPERIAGPDNIYALVNGELLVSEDGGKKAHPVNMLWLMK